jgi:hypothetical protein
MPTNSVEVAFDRQFAEVILPSMGLHRYHIKERISMASAKHPMEFGKTPHRSRSYSGKIAGYV